MKIWYENTRVVKDPENHVFFKRLRENFKKVCRPDTKVVFRSPSKGVSEMKYIMPGTPYYQFLRDIEMVEGYVQAEREGYDAAIIGCFGDPSIDVARSIINIPIIGAGGSALLYAQMLGMKTVGLTILPGMENYVAKFLAQYGLKAITRVHTLSPEEIDECCEGEGDPNKFIDEFVERAKEMIKEGAEAVMDADVMGAALLTYEGVTEVEGVPVIDSTITAVKLAEFLVDMKKAGFWKSRKCVSEEAFEVLRKAYYHGSQSV